MGAFGELARKAAAIPGTDLGARLWYEVFGTRKEDRFMRPEKPPVEGGSWGRSMTSTDASFKRLLQAMRSMAPGGWTDDRYEQSRHFVGIVYIAVHRIATMWAQAEFAVYQRDDNHPDGKRPVRRDSEAYKLVNLLEKPNGLDSFGKWMYRVAQQKYLTGTALNWLVPNRFGRPAEMYVVPTATAIPQPAINPDFPDGYYRIQPLYPYGPFSSYPTPQSAVGAAIDAKWMMRFQFPHPLLRYEGYSPLSGLRLHIDAVEMVDRSRFTTMRRAIHPSAVVNLKDFEGANPLPAAEIDRIIAEFEASFMGPENQGHLMVAPPGGSIEPWGAGAEEMGYRDGWEQLTSFVLAGLGITKPVAGMTEDSAYSTLYASLKQFYFQELGPGLDDCARDVTRLLAPYYGDDLIVEFQGKQINDHEVASGKISNGIAAKCMTKNEVRKLLDMPVTQEPWGEEIAGTEPQEPGQEGQPGAPGQEQAPGQEGAQPGQEQSQVQQPDQFQQLEAQFEQREGADEVEKARETPGELSKDSLGPRKSLVNRLKRLGFHVNGHGKSLMEIHRNGGPRRGRSAC